MKRTLECLIPAPRKVDLRTGAERFPARLHILFKGRVLDSVPDLAEFSAKVLRMPHGPSGAGSLTMHIRLGRIPGVSRLAASEAYELRIGKEVELLGGQRGLKHGIQTLRQLLEGAAVPGLIQHCVIKDWPRTTTRGIHVDLAREMEYRPDFLRRVVENLSYLKMNVLHLYLENKFVYPSAPEVAPTGVMTPAQAKELCAYAKLFGITIIPQISTLGHMEHLLNGKYAEMREDPSSSYNLCPTHPKAREFLAGLIADVAAAFDSPYIHVGYDESDSGVCPRCRRHGAPQKILAEHLNWLNAEVKKHGARTMIYGDKFLSREDFPRADAVNGGTPAQAKAALKPVSRDIIITDWHYTAPYGDTVGHLVKQGFEVQIATATNMYWHDSIPLHRGHHWIVQTMDSAIRQGATGGFNTNWEYYRGQYLENYWFFEGLAAERLWTDKPHDYVTWGRRFSTRFWGVEDDYYTELAGLCEVMQTSRKRAFLDTHVLAVDIPVLGQAVFDFAETGDEVISLVKRLRKAAIRNNDTLRMLDMPGHVIRYLGTRAAQRTLLAVALKKQDRQTAIRCVKAIREAATAVADKFNEGYKCYGGAVKDRERITVHIQQLDAYSKLVGKVSKTKLPSLVPDEYLSSLQREAPDSQNFISDFKASACLPPLRDIQRAVLPPKETLFERAAYAADEHFADIRRFHDGQDGIVYIKGIVNLPRSGKGRLLYGSDGPVKVWINGKERGCATDATNPVVADKYSCGATWRKGANEVVFALNTNRGLAWGVMARWQL